MEELPSILESEGGLLAVVDTVRGQEVGQSAALVFLALKGNGCQPRHLHLVESLLEGPALLSILHSAQEDGESSF